MKRFRFLAVLSVTTLLLGMTGCKKESSINIQELEQSLVGLWWDEFEYEDVTETGHGLILALQDAPAQTWYTINGWTSTTDFAGTTLKVLPDAAAHGSLTSYTTLGTTAVSDWAVAQKSDYEAIFTNLGSTNSDSNGTTYDDNVNAYITTGVGGTALSSNYRYWSATVLNNEYAWDFHSYYSWYSGYKTSSYSVRPVLGF